MKVVITRQAESDLEAIADFIAADNPARARSFLQELRDCCVSLGHMPQAYPVIPRYAQQNIRRRVHGHFLILFRVRADVVEVLHVVHGARDVENLL